MPTLEFTLTPVATISGVHQNTSDGGSRLLGLFYTGGTKSVWDRFLMRQLDLSSLVGKTRTDAWLEMNCNSLTGLTGQAATIRRVTRNNWTLNATWNKYDGTNNWTTGGGDVDNTTPTPVGFLTPAATGLQTITGMLGFVEDAIAERSNQLDLHVRLDDETDDGENRRTTYNSSVLVVEYELPPGDRRRLLAQVV